MTIAATSLAAALWDRYGWIDAIRRSSRKDAQQMLLMCFCIDNVLSRWTPRYLTDILKGTLFPPMFAHSLSTDSGEDADVHSLFVITKQEPPFLLLFCFRYLAGQLCTWILKSDEPHTVTSGRIRPWQVLNEIWGCTSGGVCVPCIYTYARWELP